MAKGIFTIANDIVRQNIVRAIMAAKPYSKVVISDASRSLEQNSRMWAMLADVSKQATLRGDRYTTDEWKVIFMQKMNFECPFLPTIEGTGFFPAGYSSSALTVREMCDLQTCIEAFAAENNIVLNDKNYPMRAA